MALTPELTPLDRRVLEAVQTPMQPYYIACRFVPSPSGAVDGPSWDRYWRKVDAEREQVVAILRGLEHLGLVKRKAGGWWVAT